MGRRSATAQPSFVLQPPLMPALSSPRPEWGWLPCPAAYTIGVWSVIVRRAVVRVAALLLTSVITFTV